MVLLSRAVLTVLPCDLRLAPHLRGEAKTPALRSQDCLKVCTTTCGVATLPRQRIMPPALRDAAAHAQNFMGLFG